MPNDAYSHFNLRSGACGGYCHPSSLEVFLSSATGSYYSRCFSLQHVSHYVSRYCNHYYYHSTCESCVLQSIIHHYNCCNGFHLHGPNQHWASIMWFCCHSWFQGTQWGVLLTSSPWHSNNLSPSCIIGNMPTMPCVLHRWVSLSELSLTLIHISNVGDIPF